MRRPSNLLCLAAFGLFATAAIAPAFAADASFNDAQKSAIEDIVRNLLLEKEPELILDGAKAAESKMMQQNMVKSSEGIKKFKDKIYNDAKNPIAGNPKGDVTIVEFFDYNCGYCKLVNPSFMNFVAADKNTRIVFKEYPILGDVSVIAAKAALASVKQGKYEAFHNAMMRNKDHLTETKIFDVAKTVGLDVEKLKKTMKDDEGAIRDQLNANAELAHNIAVHGTPGFIIGEKMIPGAMKEEGFKEAVEEARKAQKDAKK